MWIWPRQLAAAVRTTMEPVLQVSHRRLSAGESMQNLPGTGEDVNGVRARRDLALE
jgi:hypothetical protein